MGGVSPYIVLKTIIAQVKNYIRFSLKFFKGLYQAIVIFKENELVAL
jgi:hypothetical protein